MTTAQEVIDTRPRRESIPSTPEFFASPEKIEEFITDMGPLEIKLLQTVEPLAKLVKDRGGFLDKVLERVGRVRTEVGLLTPEEAEEVIREIPAVSEGKLVVDKEKVLGSASVAEIYEASSPLYPGKKFAVKVQKPKAKKKFEESLEKMGVFAEREDLSETDRAYSAILLLMAEMAERAFAAEFDFGKEKENLKKLRQIGIKTPRVYEELSSDKAITMDCLEEVTPISEFAKESDINLRKKVIGRYLGSIIKMLRRGLIHGDPHGGNVLVEKNRDISWVDPSPLVEFSVFELIPITKLLIGLSKNNRYLIIDALKNLSPQKPDKRTIENLKIDCHQLDNIEFIKKLAESNLLPKTKYIYLARALVEGFGTVAELLPEKQGLFFWLKIILKGILQSIF